MEKLLCAGINVYQDYPGLKRCIESIIDHMDKIFVIDGRYPDWGSESDPAFSTDGTKEYCESLPSKVEYHRLFAEQKVKRSKYMELAEGCRFLLVIDADDFVINDDAGGLYLSRHVSDWDLFLNTLATSPRFEHELTHINRYAHNIRYLVSPPNNINYFGKLIYKPSELYYASHWILLRRTDNLRQKYQNMGDPDCVAGIVMSGNDLARGNNKLDVRERLKIDTDYQWALMHKEGDLSDSEYNNIQLKDRFVMHNIHELEAWRE